MSVITTAKADEYYEALINRDSSYVGIFYVGVTTTSVFCISTCRARKPKRKNVIFYNSYAEALNNGFRPCKICCPTQNSSEAPPQIVQAIELIKNNPKSKVSDYMLEMHGISPSMVRRWFKAQYGITFHAFQRMYRINHAYKELKDGKRTTDTAFELGYESLSGFGYTYKKLLGQSPTAKSDGRVILMNRLTTPLGPMIICASDEGICLLEFTDRKMLETEFRDIQQLLQAQILVGENAHIKLAKTELTSYFSGTLQEFTVPIDSPGTIFQQSVWKALQAISYGSTLSYQELAIFMDKDNAVRAIARANGYNRIAIIIPCHRIIGKDGNLRGYGGGLARKKWLIDFEKKNVK